MASATARAITYADVFLAIAICFVVATVLVPAMHKVKAEAAPSSAESH